MRSDQKVKNLVYSSKMSPKGGAEKSEHTQDRDCRKEPFLFFLALSSSAPSTDQFFIGCSHKRYFPAAVLGRSRGTTVLFRRAGSSSQCRVRTCSPASPALSSITCLTPAALEFIVLALVLFHIFQWARGGPRGQLTCVHQIEK